MNTFCIYAVLPFHGKYQRANKDLPINYSYHIPVKKSKKFRIAEATLICSVFFSIALLSCIVNVRKDKANLLQNC